MSDNDISIRDFYDYATFYNSSLSSGFIIPADRFVYIVENEIFSRKRIIRSKKEKFAKGLSMKEAKMLNIGDYLVHSDRGIGIFEGFQTITVDGSKQDCIKVLYANDGVLYVNLNSISKIHKYAAADGAVPRLSKLGAND